MKRGKGGAAEQVKRGRGRRRTGETRRGHRRAGETWQGAQAQETRNRGREGRLLEGGFTGLLVGNLASWSPGLLVRRLGFHLGSWRAVWGFTCAPREAVGVSPGILTGRWGFTWAP